MYADLMSTNAALSRQMRFSRAGVSSVEKSPGIIGAMTVNSLLENTSSQAPGFARTSTLPKQRKLAARRNSTWSDNGDFEVRQGLLRRLLIDDEENINRLYNIVNQIGLYILFFDENETLIGYYGSARNDNHQHAGVERAFNWVFARKTAQRDNGDIVPIGTTDIGETEKVIGEGTSGRSFGSVFGHTIATNCAASISAQAPNPSCLAARISDAEGLLIGFLDVLPADGGLTVEASALANTVLQTTARTIEERAFRRRYHREWIIALATPDAGGRGMLIAVDGQEQRIVGADHYAQSRLSARNVDFGNGAPLWALFKKDAALFRKGNIADIHVGLVAVGGTEIWAAILTPPITAALHHHIPEYASLHSRARLDTISFFRRPAPPASSVGGLTPRALQRVREYVEEHLAENIELETLANIARLSKWHFARAFKQSVGTPPHFYSIQRRLERAKELLAATDLSLAQIALKSGFNDQSHFSRRFRMFVGVTPRSFRWSKR